MRNSLKDFDLNQIHFKYHLKNKTNLKLNQQVLLKEKIGTKFSKSSLPQNEYNLFLRKSFDVYPLSEELLLIKAFVGDFYKKTNLSQESLILGYKNQYSFYNIHTTLKLLIKTLAFVKSLLKNKTTKFVFVGSPLKAEKSCSLLFRNFNIPFFPNETWRPGFFSIKKSRCDMVLVIYNPALNNMAFYEALNKDIPVVGFATPYCDIRGLDYPIILNLENSDKWYASFWKTLLKNNN